MESKIKDFTDLRVWQDAHRFVIAIYTQTKTFPKEEMYGLTSQIRRAAVSVTSNIAEGFGRRGEKEKCQFYFLAAGSLAEVQSQLFVARDVGFLSEESFFDLRHASIDVYRQLNALISSISHSKP